MPNFQNLAKIMPDWQRCRQDPGIDIEITRI